MDPNENKDENTAGTSAAGPEDDTSRVKKAVEAVRSGVGSVFSVIAGRAAGEGLKEAVQGKIEGFAPLRRENIPRIDSTGESGAPLKNLAFPKAYTPSGSKNKDQGKATPPLPFSGEVRAPRPTAADLGVTAANAKEEEVIESAHHTSLPHTKERIEGDDEKPKTAKDLLLAMTSFLTGKKEKPPPSVADAAPSDGVEKSARRDDQESEEKESAAPKEETKTSGEDEVTKAAATIVEEKPKKEELAEAATKKSKESTWIRPLRTYKDDIAQAIQGTKTSFVSMVAAEEKKRAARTPAPAKRVQAPSSPRMKLAIISASFSLIVLGIASVFFFAFLKEETGTVAPGLRTPSLVFIETESEFALEGRTGTDLRNALATYVLRQQATLNTFLQVLIIKETVLGVRPALSADLFTALQMTLKDSAVRSLGPSFTFGIHAFGENRPFLIFSVDSFELAFRGMLDWESSMNRELSPWFGPVVIQSLFSPSDSGQGLESVAGARFVDRIIKNKDTRVLLDENGRVALLYSFIDRDTLVITTNTATFEEIVTRISQRRVQ